LPKRASIPSVSEPQRSTPEKVATKREYGVTWSGHGSVTGSISNCSARDDAATRAGSMPCVR
jgi:hypothetical protein